MQPSDAPNQKVSAPEETTLGVEKTISNRTGDVAEPSESFSSNFSIEQFENPGHKMVGRILNDHFKLNSLLGNGGMGYVYKATDLALKKTVAVKMLRPHLASDPTSIRRLQQEALATSSLDHPNTVAVRHFDMTSEGEPYLVMDYLDGVSLTRLLTEEGRIEVPRAVKMSIQIAEAVQSAHEKHIVHRDLKPSNVLLITHDGRPDFVKVVDFGIAKVINPDEGDGPPTMTMTGEIFGSPLAMSPEQCRGDKVDFRSDIYSFGCMMYEMLTGKPVFQERHTLAVMYKQMNEMPESFKVACPEAKIPPKLEAIVFKALQKDAKNRYQSMKDMIADLYTVDKTTTLDHVRIRFALALHNKKRLRIVAGSAVLTVLVLCGLTGLGTHLSRADNQLLTSVVGWQSPPPAKLPIESRAKLSEDARLAIKKAETYIETQLNPKKGNLASLSLSRTEAIAAVSHLHGEAVRLARLHAYDELDKVAQYSQLAAEAFISKTQNSANTGDLRTVAMMLKDIADLELSVGSFEQALQCYSEPVRMSQKFGTDYDVAYFRKYMADSSYAMASRRPTGNEDYANAANYYEFFLNCPNHLLKLVSPNEFAYADGRKFPFNSNDLENTPLVWDAHHKLADCRYLRIEKAPDYSKTAELYRWCEDHISIFPHKELKDVPLFYWRKADCERMSGLNNAGPNSSDGAASMSGVVDTVFQDYRNGLYDPHKTAKNTALCQAYMVALTERFNIPRERWAGVQYATYPDAIEALKKTFGADDPTTILVEREYADTLWAQKNYLSALQVSAQAKLMALKEHVLGSPRK